MKRQLLPAHTQIPAGRYALMCVPSEKTPASLWRGEHDSDTRLYGRDGAEQEVFDTKTWEAHTRLMLLTDDEAARLLTAAKLLDLRHGAWTDYVTNFVSTLTDEEAPA